jgi:hypothetical protein
LSRGNTDSARRNTGSGREGRTAPHLC